MASNGVTVNLGSGRSLSSHAGVTLLEALNSAGVRITAPCGGEGTCGKCRIQASGTLAPVTPAERQLLTPEQLQSGLRLACQAQVQGDVDISVPDTSSQPEMRIVEHGAAREIQAEPAVIKCHITVPEQTLSQPYSRLEHLSRCGDLRADLVTELSVLQRLPSILDSVSGSATAVMRDNVLMAVESGNTVDQCYGVAIDLGTTTVVASLVDLNDGRELARAATVNAQTRFGHDVVSRINTALEQRDGLRQLQEAAHESIALVLKQVLTEAGIPSEQVYDAALVGNSTMAHLCLGIHPGSLGRMPYVSTAGPMLLAPPESTGLSIHPEARTYVLPSIAGFVGADTVGAILAASLDEDDGRTRLLVDIGTNCEIVLRLGDRLLVTSTPAGPAFEGARITCGMYAAPGAIESVRLDGEVGYRTIGDQEARGLCGSGLVDISAELLRVGIIDATGRMVGPDELDSDVAKGLRQALIEHEEGMAFVLHNGGGGGRVFLTQRDVRELQLAKGAIRSGIDLLLEYAGLSPDALDEFIVAGGFGSYIDKHNAMRLGMLPRLDPDKMTFIGNGALVGARLALLSRTLRRRGEQVARTAEHLQLAHTPDYQMRFSESMMFDP